MAKVNWTFQALEDVESIAEYHSNNSESYASFLIDQFFESVHQLEQFPLSGRIVPEVNVPHIREILVNRYRILYSVVNRDKVDVLAVRPSAIPLEDFSR